MVTSLSQLGCAIGLSVGGSSLGRSWTRAARLVVGEKLEQQLSFVRNVPVFTSVLRLLLYALLRFYGGVQIA